MFDLAYLLVTYCDQIDYWMIRIQSTDSKTCGNGIWRRSSEEYTGSNRLGWKHDTWKAMLWLEPSLLKLNFLNIEDFMLPWERWNTKGMTWLANFFFLFYDSWLTLHLCLWLFWCDFISIKQNASEPAEVELFIVNVLLRIQHNLFFLCILILLR